MMMIMLIVIVIVIVTIMIIHNNTNINNHNHNDTCTVLIRAALQATVIHIRMVIQQHTTVLMSHSQFRRIKLYTETCVA